MKVRCDILEHYLITGTLIFSFFYFVIRFLLIDNFIWIILFPLLCFSYILLYSERFTFKGFNSLDKVVYIYLLFGFLMTILGLFISKYKLITLEVFAHYYLPAVIYFISRKYTSYSAFNFVRVIRIIWILAILLIIDMFIESIFYRYNLSSTFVPWAYMGEENYIKYSISWFGQGYDKIGSILTSSKTTEMVFASLFCFIYPFTMNYKIFKQYYLKKLFATWQVNILFNITTLFFILICIIGISELTNKTAFVSLLLVLIFFSVNKFSLKRVIFLLLGLVLIVIIFQDFLFMIYIDNFVKAAYKVSWDNVYESSTVFQAIFNWPRLILHYQGISFYDLIFGKYLITGINSSQPFTNLAIGTELRLFTSPVYFGLIWTSIVITMGFLIIKYCFRLINKRKRNFLSYLGLSFLGFYLIYFLDFHYPVFIRHGPIELFFVLTGALSSFNSCYMGKEIQSNMYINRK